MDWVNEQSRTVVRTGKEGRRAGGPEGRKAGGQRLMEGVWGDVFVNSDLLSDTCVRGKHKARSEWRRSVCLSV